MPTVGRLVVALCSLVGAALIGLGVLRALNESKFLSTAAKSLGEVVEIQTTPIDEGTNRYCAVVRFEPAKGKTSSFVSAVCGSSQLQRVGDKVPVLYDPAEPSNGRIAEGGGPWNVAEPFVVWGLVGWIAAVAAALLFKRFAR